MSVQAMKRARAPSLSLLVKNRRETKSKKIRGKRILSRLVWREFFLPILSFVRRCPVSYVTVYPKSRITPLSPQLSVPSLLSEIW